MKVHLGLFVCLFFLDQGIQTRGLAAPPNAGDTSGLAEDSLQRFTFPGEGAEGPLCRGKGDLDGAARVYQSPGRSLGLFFWTPKRMKLQPEIQRAPLPRVFMGPPLGTKYNPGREAEKRLSAWPKVAPVSGNLQELLSAWATVGTERCEAVPVPVARCWPPGCQPC